MRLIINIDAPDVDAAARFYEEGLGLQPVRRLFAGRIAEMRLGDQLFHIIPKHPGGDAYPGGGGRNYARHWTPLHLDFMVTDLDAALARATAAGAMQERPITAHDWGSIAGLADPFGHGFCLIELSTAGYDAVA